MALRDAFVERERGEQVAKDSGGQRAGTVFGVLDGRHRSDRILYPEVTHRLDAHSYCIPRQHLHPYGCDTPVRMLGVRDVRGAMDVRCEGCAMDVWGVRGVWVLSERANSNGLQTGDAYASEVVATTKGWCPY